MVNIVAQDYVSRFSLNPPRALLLFVYLPDTTLCLGLAVIYKDRDKSTKARDRGNIYTVTSQTGSLTGKRWNVCLFEGRWGGIGLVCLGVVVLALVPPPTGIHCCLFGHQFTPVTFPNGWLIPVKATVGPLASTSSYVASLWTDWWTPAFFLSFFLTHQGLVTELLQTERMAMKTS